MLPLQSFEFVGTDFGSAVFLIGLLAILLLAGLQSDNSPALIMWCFTALILVFIGVFGIAVELFWLAAIATLILLAVGFVVRWAV